MFHTIAVHHVRPEHEAAFVAFMHRVEQAVAGAPGLVEFSSHRDAQRGVLVAIGRWEGQEAFAQAMPTIMGLSGERDPAWTEREDELFALTPA